MTNLLWPGDQRAGDLMTDEALLDAMVAAESAWVKALVTAGLAPADCAGTDLRNLLSADDCASLASTAEDGANPVIGLVALLRERADPAVAPWIHRGLSSQDVLDTALMLGMRAAADRITSALIEQMKALCTLVERHRHTPMVARTLTQHAVPTRFGAKAAGWLRGVTDACQRLAGLITPVQIGGAAGTLAAATELARLLEGEGDPARIALRLVEDTALTLGLSPRASWHTTRTPMTDAADAMVACTGAWGHIAADVVTLTRPEIAELSETTTDNRGRSSSMPQKRNPVLSILVRRAALAAPSLAATLHLAAALANDERPDGAWHAEWDTLRTLVRRTIVAAAQCAELVTNLQVHSAQMAANLAKADVLHEQRAIADFVGKPASPTYFGAVDMLIDETLEHARRVLRELA